MIFFDAHSHQIKNQTGGILIGLEGKKDAGISLNNNDINIIVSKDNRFVGCYYVTKERNVVPDETVLKYHPRREQYTADEVIKDLNTRKCKLCIIDTLNQPQWGYLDYWKVVAAFPNIKFILPHMGGYDIVDFVKILDFNKNVYCDFSMTQEYFGWCGSRPRYAVVADSIDYCISHSKLSNRVLFGSDEPYFNQNIALEKYATLPNAKDLLEYNYIKFINSL